MVQGDPEVPPDGMEMLSADAEAEDLEAETPHTARRLQSRRRDDGSRGGRNRRKKPAAAAAAENGQTDEAPTPATIHVPSPVRPDDRRRERGRRAAAQEEANAPRLARRPQPAQEARRPLRQRPENGVVKKQARRVRGPLPGLALRSWDDLVRAGCPQAARCRRSASPCPEECGFFAPRSPFTFVSRRRRPCP